MFRNPNEGMSKFLGSIGDMRRTWEQEEQIRQQQARAAEKHKQDTEIGALNMAMAKSREEREAAEGAQRAALHPGALVQQGQQTNLNSLKLTEAQQQIKNLEHAHAQAVQWDDKEAQAKIESLLASTKAANASAANSGVMTRRNQLGLDQETRTDQTLQGLWGKPASSMPGAPTYGEVQALGGLGNTAWGGDYLRDANEYHQLLQAAAWGGGTEAQLAKVNELGARIGREPITMDQFIQVNRRSAGGSDIAARLAQAAAGGTTAGNGTADINQLMQAGSAAIAKARAEKAAEAAAKKD
jgi:hypothetical protein